MKNKIIVIALLVTGGILAALWLAGCSEKIVNDSNEAGLALKPNFTVKGDLEAVEIFRVRVEAEDIPVPIVVEMQMINGLLVADVPVPAGRNRKITVEALDIDLNVIYRGVRIIDIYPSDVELPLIGIDLMPTVPIIKVTPHYNRVSMGIPFTCDVEVYSITDLYNITFTLSQSSNIARFDSVSKGSSLAVDDYFSYDIYWMDLGQEAIITASAPDNNNIIVDGTGWANLATFYFSSYSVTDEDIDYISIVPTISYIQSNEDGVIDTIPRDSIFVDEGRAELPRRTFELTFGGLGSDIGEDIVQTPDGNFAIVGNTTSFGAASTDIYLMRIDSLGNFIGDVIIAGASYDYGKAIINTRDGGLAIVGYTDVGTVSSSYKVQFIKTDLFGNVDGQKTFGTTGYDFGYDIKQNTDGSFVITGSREDSVFIIKTDVSGNVLWDKAYEDTVSSHIGRVGYSIVRTGDGGYLVAGEVWFPNESQAGYLLKANAQGDFVWDKVFVGSMNCTFNSIDRTNDGNYIITGGYDDDVYLVKINDNGGVIWEKFYGGPDFDRGYSVVTCRDGGFFVTGYYYDQPSDKVGQMYMIKTDFSGEIVWDTTFGEYSTDYGYSGIPTAAGGYISCGYNYSFGQGNDILVVKTDAYGRTYLPIPSR